MRIRQKSASATWFGIQALSAEAFANESDIELTDCYVVVAWARVAYLIHSYLEKLDFQKFFLHDFYEFITFLYGIDQRLHIVRKIILRRSNTHSRGYLIIKVKKFCAV